MKFIFHYEFKDLVGGLTSLYITIFEELIRQGQEFVFFNYTDGIVGAELKKKGISLPVIDIPTYSWDELTTLVSSNDILVITSFDEALNRFMHVNPRIFYYTVHEFIGDISRYKFGLNPVFLGRSLVKKLERANSLLLMDDTGIRNTKDRFKHKITHPIFLPIPVKVPPANQYKAPVNSTLLKLSYVGRSAVWKMMPLKHILKQASSYVQFHDVKIVFSIAVDSIENMRQFIKVEELQSSKLEINLYERIPPAEINEFLSANTHLGFGMGTVALDYAKLGIPVVLVDFSKTEFPDSYTYQWLYNTQYFCIGKNILENPEVITSGIPFDVLINSVRESSAFLGEQSGLSYDYVSKYHGVNNFVHNLKELSVKCSFRLRDAKPNILYYWGLHRMLKKLK